MCDSRLFVQVLGKVTTAPLAVREFAALDRSQVLVKTLGAEAGEVWIVRPAAHVAAIISQAEPVRVAATMCRVPRHVKDGL